MNTLQPDEHRLPLPVRLALGVLVILFLVIGVIGLVLPIIPGIVFLALAALLLAKISSRFAFHLDNHALWARCKRHWRSLRFLSLGERVRLSLLLLARSTVDGLDSALRWLRQRGR